MTLDEQIATQVRAAVREALADATPALVAQVAAAVRAQQGERWVTRAEAAKAMALSVDSIDRRCADGTLTCRRIGKKSVRVLLPGAPEMLL